MFTVINKKSDKCYTVYAVRTMGVIEQVQFLIYENHKWSWESASDYKPLE